MVKKKGGGIMPTFTYNKRDLLGLIGKRLSDNELKEIINSIKPEVEEISKDEIVVEFTPDRPDLFGIEGLARAIRFYLGIQKVKKYVLALARLKVKVERVKVRPFVASAVVRKVKLNDRSIKSLMHIQDALTDTLGRKRRKVAIGIHDLDKITPPIVYTSAPPSEKMVPLGEKKEMSLKEILKVTEKGKEYAHIISKAKTFPVFRDKLGIFSFPPIINSERTRVTQKTKNLFLDLTAIEERSLEQCLNILVTNFYERGWKIEKVLVKYPNKKIVYPRLKEEKLKVEVEPLLKLIGLRLEKNVIRKCLERMGLEAKIKGRFMEVLIPPYRVDILHPVDLAEEIAIGYGYDKIIPQLPNLATVGKLHSIEKFLNEVRMVMVGLGFQEIMRPILSSPKKQFENMNLDFDECIELENPVSTEYTMLRVWLLPNLLEVLSVNQHVEYPQKIFEVGRVVLPDKKSETRSKEFEKLSCVISDSRLSYEEISSVMDAFLSSFGVKYELRETLHPSFIDGRVAEIIVNGKSIGVLGEIHPSVLKNWKLEMPVLGMEINLSFLIKDSD